MRQRFPARQGGEKRENVSVSSHGVYGTASHWLSLRLKNITSNFLFDSRLDLLGNVAIDIISFCQRVKSLELDKDDNGKYKL